MLLVPRPAPKILARAQASRRGTAATLDSKKGADRRRRHRKKNLIAAGVSKASDVAPVRIVGLAVASLALLLMLLRRGLDVTMMIRYCLTPC